MQTGRPLCIGRKCGDDGPSDPYDGAEATIPLEDAVPYGCGTPPVSWAYPSQGNVAAGQDADIVLLDRDLNVRAVWAMGKLVEGTNKLF